MGFPFTKNDPMAPFRKLFAQAKRARRPYERDFLLNLAFYLDEQYVEWREDISAVRRVPREERFLNTPRPVANKIMHFINQSHAQALHTRPTADVLPATDDIQDLTTSSVAKAYLDWLVAPQIENFDLKLSDATMWALIAGVGFLKWTFDPKNHRPAIYSCSPMDVFPDPFQSNFPDCRYVFHRRFMDAEQVYDIYGVEVRERVLEVVDPVRTELLRSMGYTSGLKGVQVYELWHRPSRRFPEGLFVAWTGGTVLVPPQKLPYDHGQLPFTMLGVIPRPGTWCHNSAVKYLRPGQMELNKYHAQRIMIREAFANPKWFIDSQLAQGLNQLPDDSPRQVLIGDSDGGRLVPHILQPAAMSDNNEGVWISQEMMNIVGQHEVSQAQVPGRVEAAKAIEMLQESDISRLTELNRTIDLSISEGFWQCLQLAQQYVTDEQVVSTYSREGIPEVKRFMTSNFKQGMKIRVTRGTGLATSRAARQDQLLMLWQNRVITDPAIMAEMMELPYPTFIQADAFDIKLARAENFTIAGGQAIMPNSWDNHAIHIREHNNWRKTQEYLEGSNDTKQKFEHHVDMHEQLAIQVAKKMAMQQQEVMAAVAPQGMPPGGAPPGGGGGNQLPGAMPPQPAAPPTAGQGGTIPA